MNNNNNVGYSQAFMEILQYIAESNELPWVIQVVLLKILEITEFEAGAIQLTGGETYSFTVQEGLPEPFFPHLIASADDDGLFVRMKEEEPAMQCLLDKISRQKQKQQVWKSKYGSIVVNKISAILKDAHFSKKNFCSRCIYAGYETVALIPLKAGMKTTGFLYLFHKNPYALGAESFLLLESIINPLGYAVQHMQAQERLKESYLKNRSLSKKILHAYEEERARLSRDLHDEVGQVLTAIKLDLQILKRDYGKPNFDVLQKLQQNINMVDSLMDFTRAKAYALRPPALDSLGITAAIENMTDEFSQRTGIKTKFSKERYIDDKVPDEVEIALFRCIQESLTNISRHARAKEAAVVLGQNKNNVTVQITDDGVGFDANEVNNNGQSIGLAGMQERVDLLDGSMKIDSRPGCGTSIVIEVKY